MAESQYRGIAEGDPAIVVGMYLSFMWEGCKMASELMALLLPTNIYYAVLLTALVTFVVGDEMLERAKGWVARFLYIAGGAILAYYLT